MSRFQKQLLYGFFFLLIFAVLGWAVYGFWERGRGNCFDGVRNQDEAGIDCGGVCSLCIVTPLYQPLRVLWSDFYSAGTSTVYVAAEVVNPNAEYGASRFPYVFQIFDEKERVMQTIRGTRQIGPAQRVLVYGALTDIPVRLVGGVALLIESDVSWEEKSVFPAFSPVVVGSPTFTVLGDTMAVEGVLENNGNSVIPELHAVAVLRDEFGFRLLVAGISLSRLAPFSLGTFRIEIPHDARIAGKTRKTEVFLYPEEN